ncbi:hypothetical protein NT05LI_3073 [Listeria ivanovii FSL F6-596]|nr:hypothetical protein NT05LI_3073 [Listeria ivanovii FSL F6-596]
MVKEFDTIIRKFRDRKFFSQEKERKKQPMLTRSEMHFDI